MRIYAVEVFVLFTHLKNIARLSKNVFCCRSPNIKIAWRVYDKFGWEKIIRIYLEKVNHKTLNLAKPAVKQQQKHEHII